MTALAATLKDLIRNDGPISVAEYMRIVLTGRDDSYYMRGEAFGAAGDFVTAPDISQIFGELIGLWSIDVWRQLGSPTRFSLVELGPGRGTLMKDALRAARMVPEFIEAASISLVEVSPALRVVQRAALHGMSVQWFNRFEDLASDGPLIVVANEFFDALPIRQFVRCDKGWAERCVGLDQSGELAFGASPDAINDAVIPHALRTSAAGSIVEMAPARAAVASAIGARLRDAGGAALIIDYGFSGPAVGDTLQAVRRHAYADVLSEPGAADVTSHVDFTALAEALIASGVERCALAEQGAFLVRLGASERVARLKRSASAQQSEQLDAAYQRLTASDAMGSLFKVLCAVTPATLQPAGFADR